MCFAGVPVYKWGAQMCWMSQLWNYYKKYIFCLFISLQSVFLPLSTLQFSVAWWPSADIKSRTGLLLFVVSFNPTINSCRFLRTRTFFTRKLWGGGMGGRKHDMPNPTHKKNERLY